jgi:trehalose 6-phosphate synthase/phosphatase
MMGKLIIASNRLPITITKRKGKFKVQSSAGGLVTALGGLEKSQQRVWVGWPGISMSPSNPESKDIKALLEPENYHPVFLSRSDIEDYYHGFCNETIWPLFHYFVQFALFDKDYWKAYKSVNEAFCDEIMEIAEPGDTFWIHDYHLMILPELLKETLQEAKIGFFLHIPFPSSEIFRLLPWSKEIIDGLLGADLIGFHTFDYVRHFLESVRRVLGYEHTFGQITVHSRAVKVDAFPMGVDYEKFSNAAQNPDVQKSIRNFQKEIGGEFKIILSIDRLDYTKGIPQRLEAFDLFLKRNPGYKGKVIFILVAVPSRTEVKRYKLLKEQIDNLVGNINGRHGKIGWVPIWYLYRSYEFNDLAALYSISDVIFVTPLRDGMNLIAKEYVATKNDGNGVLILGEMAGTAKELIEAIIINPNDVETTANALKLALEMPADERASRINTMRLRLRRYDVRRWAGDFMEKLDHIDDIQRQMKSRVLSMDFRNKITDDYSKAQNRLFLLDYDGTLMPFNENPEKVEPDHDLVKTLTSLFSKQNNQLVIISGRDRKTLERWVDKFTDGLVAEHGVWIKDEEWKTIENLSDKWKEDMRRILEIYVDRTPGSFIEEKDYSLVWHFRKADPALAMVRVGELKEILLHITGSLNVGVLEGNKVIEIKNTEVSKGRAAMYWLSKEKWDFILSIGDDSTDEDIFEALPDWAYSIKVGLGPSKARFTIPSFIEVRELLKELAGV